MKPIFALILSLLFLCALSKAQDPKADEEWSFAVVGDTHIPKSQVLKDMVPELIKDKVSAILFPGDIVHAGKAQIPRGLANELKTWNDVVAPLKDAGIKLLAVRGNHEADVRRDNLTPWLRNINKDLNFSFQYRGVTFIGIDNYVKGEKTVDVEWLEKEIARHTNSLIIPFGHEALFSSSTFHPTCLDGEKETRNKVWDLFRKANIHYYFCGHAHQYNLSQISQGNYVLTQVVSGGGGGTLHPKRQAKSDEGFLIKSLENHEEHGYTLVTVKNGKLHIRWKPLP